MIPVEPTPNFSSLSLSYFPLICIMEYISSDQSSISSLSRKENVSHFEFNVTSPILESKKTKTKKIGKLVDQVKKFKKQAPRIHNDIHNDDIGCHGDNNPISIFDAKEAAAGVANTAAGTEFFVSEAPTYKSNYSENRHPHKFLSKIKKYHSSHLHLITSMIQSDDGEEEDEEELEQELEQEQDVKIQHQRPHQHHHKRYLKMTRPTKKYFKRKKKPKDQASINSFSSVSSSTTTTTSSHKRKRLHINLTNKRKRHQHRRKAPVATAATTTDEQERRGSLIQIRHQMMDFKIPADWTCISSKVNKNPTTTNLTLASNMIQGTTLLDQEIDNEIKRIETSQSAIKDYIDKIQQLNMDIEHHINLFSSIDTRAKGMQHSSIDLQKSRRLLQQAYNRHARLTLGKHTPSPSIRLEKLQIKVHSLHKSDFLGSMVFKHVRRWAFSFVLFCVMCSSFFYIKKSTTVV
ncbi:unnamed protein product [Mucor fragilis]